ncbi:MAG TPA: CBS domain-containing protein [Amaricoccus sp.]|nr:CBS domain-containing protein [Amaricoccus sp.]
MLAREVMTSPPITVTPDTPVSEVAAILLANRISAVPVLNQAGKLIGIVSEGDLLRRAEAKTERRRSKWLELLLDRNVAAADFVKTHGRAAKDVMTSDVVSVGPDTELAEIASTLERRRIKRVPVVEGGKVLGIVSRANLLQALVARPPDAKPDATLRRDAEIRKELVGRLRSIPGVNMQRVNAVVEDGTVFLWGTVKSSDQRRALNVAAESIPGVARVEDRLHLDFFPGTPA